jgi:hypothetical protein
MGRCTTIERQKGAIMFNRNTRDWQRRLAVMIWYEVSAAENSS